MLCSAMRRVEWKGKQVPLAQCWSPTKDGRAAICQLRWLKAGKAARRSIGWTTRRNQMQPPRNQRAI